MFPSLSSRSHTHLNTLHINSLTAIPSKMAPRQSLVSSLANLKKLARPQRTTQSSIKPTSEDVYNIALNSDSSRAINRDDSFHLYIACEAEEIHNAASDNGSAKDAKSQVRSCIYFSLRHAIDNKTERHLRSKVLAIPATKMLLV
jgi:hypothetical protein